MASEVPIRRPGQREQAEARGEAPRRVRVPQVVDAPRVDAGRPECGMPLAGTEALEVDVAAPGGGEEQGVFHPGVGEGVEGVQDAPT